MYATTKKESMQQHKKKTRRKEKERKKEQKQTLVFRLSSIQVDLDHNIMHSKTNG